MRFPNGLGIIVKSCSIRLGVLLATGIVGITLAQPTHASPALVFSNATATSNVTGGDRPMRRGEASAKAQRNGSYQGLLQYDSYVAGDSGGGNNAQLRFFARGSRSMGKSTDLEVAPAGRWRVELGPALGTTSLTVVLLAVRSDPTATGTQVAKRTLASWRRGTTSSSGSAVACGPTSCVLEGTLTTTRLTFGRRWPGSPDFTTEVSLIVLVTSNDVTSVRVDFAGRLSGQYV